MKKVTFFLALALSIPCGLRAAESLEQQFQNPPEATKPYCYWYWLNGDITKEGITKDLEAMAKVGIQPAMIGNIQEDPKRVGPVKMFTPEWYDLTRHAMKEAAHFGVEISMFNAPGWSQSGGPWIKPEQSMRRITWNEIPAKGGKFSAKVRPDIKPLVQDVAVLAVPKKSAVSLHVVALSLRTAEWIWHPDEDGAKGAAAVTKYFRRVVKVDGPVMRTARMLVAADDSYTLWINGKEVHRGPAERNVADDFSIQEYLKPGDNVIAIAVNNVEGAAGLIAAARIEYADDREQMVVTDNSWLCGGSEVNGWQDAVGNPEGWKPSRVMGGPGMEPWKLSSLGAPGKVAIRFRHTEPFTARALSVRGEKINATLYALKDGKREKVAWMRSGGAVKARILSLFLPRGFSVSRR